MPTRRPNCRCACWRSKARLLLRSSKRRRTLKAADFFTGMLTTARSDDEMVEAVRFPLARPGTGHGFEEFSMRHGDFAVCAVAAVADAKRLRIAVGGVADQAVARDFPLLDGNALGDALNEFAWSLDARDEPQASAALRRRLVRELGRRAAEQALATTEHPAMSVLSRDSLHEVKLQLNGKPRSGHAHPRLLLSDFLRHELGATGTHVGCEHGVCGACTVRVDGVAQRACMMLAVQADGREVQTVEGLRRRRCAR